MLETIYEEITEEDIEKQYSETTDIEFVSYSDYDAKCNLCNGILTLKIKGTDVTFGRYAMFKDFFSPGECWFNEGERKQGITLNTKGWDICVDYLPEEYQPYAKQIHDLLNAHMPKDYCYGCE